MRFSRRPIDDPFFREVRRRHPDVDLVLLPPERPPGPAEATEEEAADALRRVEDEAVRLWAAIAPDATEQPAARLRFGADAASVRPVATVDARRDDGVEVLARLRQELDRRGSHDDLHVSGSYAQEHGVLMVTTSGRSITVGATHARRLTAAGRAR